MICSSTQESCTNDLAVKLFKVSAFLSFFSWIRCHLDSRLGSQYKTWTIIAKNFKKRWIWKSDGLNSASNFRCIVSHLIYYNPRGIYLFRFNNAGWEMQDLCPIISSYTFTPSCWMSFCDNIFYNETDNQIFDAGKNDKIL